jgi:hypothetical protein
LKSASDLTLETVATHFLAYDIRGKHPMMNKFIAVPSGMLLLLICFLSNPVQAGTLWESEMTCIILPGAFGDARGDAEIRRDGELRASIRNLPPDTEFDCVLNCLVSLQRNRVLSCGTVNQRGRLRIRVEDFASEAALGPSDCVGVDLRLFKSGGGISCVSGFAPPMPSYEDDHDAWDKHRKKR